MFPSLKVRLSGLEDDVLYIVYVDMDLVDDKRHRYIYQRYSIYNTFNNLYSASACVRMRNDRTNSCVLQKK
jgi:hypothetical protein